MRNLKKLEQYKEVYDYKSDGHTFKETGIKFNISGERARQKYMMYLHCQQTEGYNPKE